MSHVNHKLVFRTDEKLQAASLAGVFMKSIHLMKKSGVNCKQPSLFVQNNYNYGCLHKK